MLTQEFVTESCGYHDCNLSLGVSWPIRSISVVKLKTKDFLIVSDVVVCGVRLDLSHQHRSGTMIGVGSVSTHALQFCAWLVELCMLCW